MNKEVRSKCCKAEVIRYFYCSKCRKRCETEEKKGEEKRNESINNTR